MATGVENKDDKYECQPKQGQGQAASPWLGDSWARQEGPMGPVGQGRQSGAGWMPAPGLGKGWGSRSSLMPTVRGATVCRVPFSTIQLPHLRGGSHPRLWGTGERGA